MSSTQSESSRHPLSTSSAKAPKDRPLPDIYGDDLGKHAAQDAKVLDTFKKHEFPENAMDIVPLEMYIFEIVLAVVLVARSEDPNVPLGARTPELAAAIADEDFRKVADSCYRSKSFMGIRNHRAFIICIIYNNLLILNSAALRKAAKVHCKYDSRICSSPAIN